MDFTPQLLLGHTFEEYFGILEFSKYSILEVHIYFWYMFLLGFNGGILTCIIIRSGKVVTTKMLSLLYVSLKKEILN